jgi:integrase
LTYNKKRKIISYMIYKISHSDGITDLTWGDNNVNLMGHDETLRNKKSARRVQGVKAVYSKSDARYWSLNHRLFKWEGSANYSFQLQYKGKRHAFSTGASDKALAAKIAAGIYSDFLKLGVEATLEKHRPKKDSLDRVATIGEWIDAAKKISSVNPTTFNCYAASLRLIAGQIGTGKKKKLSKSRFGPKSGGAAAYRDAINSLSLDILTLADIQKWRIAYEAKGKTPFEKKSRRTSCNSTIRQARSLFAPKIVKFIPDLKLPSPLPFEDVEFFPKQNNKYFSKIDPEELLKKAQTELAAQNPAAFLAMLLALGAGLRKGEIDSLQWNQVDFDKGLVRVETTDKADLKTSDSRGEVDIDFGTVAILRGYRAKAKGLFVIESKNLNSGAQTWGRQYRANGVFETLKSWLREQGVEARKPIHELRKELGSLVTRKYGIYAASRMLRHSSVATTEAHYTDLKSRPVINVGNWLIPENVTPITSGDQKTHQKVKRVEG